MRGNVVVVVFLLNVRPEFVFSRCGQVVIDDEIVAVVGVSLYL